MKKLLWLSICILTVFCVGCGSENVTLDLEKIKETLPSLTSDTFDAVGATNVVEDPGKDAIYGEMEDVYEYDFQSVLGLDSSNIEQYVVRKSTDNEDIYMILKPMEGKADAVKEDVHTYFKNSGDAASGEVKTKYENYLEDEYQGYLIFIVSDNNAEVLNRIKSSKELAFGALMEVDSEMLNSTFGIDTNDLEEYQVYMPMMIVSSKSYYILKPKEDKYDTVKAKMDEYMTNFETQWSTYLPEQYELVRNRMVKEYGGYLIYIISDDNEAVFKQIEASKK